MFFYRITRDINPGLVNFRNLEQRQFLLGAIGVLDGRKISDTLKVTRSHEGMHFNLSCRFFACPKGSFISKINFTLGVLNSQSDFTLNVPRMLQ